MNLPSLRPTFIAALVPVLAFLAAAHAGSLTVTGQADGPTPFIKQLQITVGDPAALAHVEFKVQPRTGSHTRPVSARYSTAYLLRRSLLNPATGELTLPLFGLYAGTVNRVALAAVFADQTSQRLDLDVPTPAWTDPAKVYLNPRIQQARNPNTTLSYDFIMLANDNLANTPVIIDTDAQVRWVGTAPTRSQGALFLGNGIHVYQNVNSSTTHLIRLELDGTWSYLGDPAVDPGGKRNYRNDGVTAFHHSFDPGKTGLLVEADTEAVPALGTDAQYQSVVLEVDPADGSIINRWDFADIFRAAISAAGEDPAGFVFTRSASPNNWFHNNSACYRPSDNTLVASSRENFVVAVDYDTKAIRWILGDPTKAWYINHPLSLRPKALALSPGTSPPIGQHSLSFVRDRLLLFDNGAASLVHTPEGASHATNAVVRKYLVDAVALTATEIWSHVANPPIASAFTSSVSEDGSRSFLIDYATDAILIGLDPSGNKAFDYRYAGSWTTMFSAKPIHLESIEFD